MLRVREKWHNILEAAKRSALESLFPAWLAKCRWFAGKAKPVRSAEIADVIPLENPEGSADFRLLLVQVNYLHDRPETYLIPVGFATGRDAAQFRDENSPALIAGMEVIRGEETISGVLYDALGDEALGGLLLDLINGQRTVSGSAGELSGQMFPAYRDLRSTPEEGLFVRALRAEQSNSTLIFGDRLLLKLYRKLEHGINPDLEVGRFLSETMRFRQTPRSAGSLSYRDASRILSTVGLLQEFVPQAQDAWNFTLEHVRRFFDRVRSIHPAWEPSPARIDAASQDFLPWASLLGRRTAEMHQALASAPENPDFAPEAFGDKDRRALTDGIFSLAHQTWQLLGDRLHELPVNVQTEAHSLLAREPELIGQMQRLAGQEFTGHRTRCHGDYHLGQVLVAGKDFVIIDFEGEPARPLSERRRKQSPLKDVAGMIRSFDYAAQTVLLNEIAGTAAADVLSDCQHGADCWSQRIGAEFLQAYFSQAQPTSPAAQPTEEVHMLLDVFLLEKAVYELSYELNNRPTWAPIPLRGLLRLLDHGK